MTRSRTIVGIVVLLALGALAANHDGLRFVDLTGFSRRAEALPAASAWMHPLYPVGYPAALRAGHAVFGDVLTAARALSVLAGAGLAAVAAGSLGAGAALAVFASATSLAWFSTEGTDGPAAALSVAAVLLATRGRAVPAGLAAAAALLVRYTAAPVPLLVLLLLPDAASRARAAVPVGLAVGVHLLGAWAAGASPWPDQSENLAIAAGVPRGAGGGALGVDTLLRWPFGVRAALEHAVGGVVPGLGAIGLILGVWRRDRRALGLLALLAVHSAVLGLAFSNPRLALPAHVAALLGWAWIVPWPALLGVVAVLGAGLSLPAARTVDPSAQAVAALLADLPALDGPVIATTPWFHQRRKDGWLAASEPISAALQDPRRGGPDELRAGMAAIGASTVALDHVRTTRNHPGLSGLYREPGPGWEVVARKGGWVVLRAR